MLKPFVAALALLCAGGAFAAVDINTASVADLDSIKGIGPQTSRAILNERQQGAFKDWHDVIARVKGIGVHHAARLSAAGLTVNGAGFAAPARPAPATPAAQP